MSETPTVKFRNDIQGLRAIAVLLVVVYHFWPQALTGGYVGVDVFFVISGFLISRILTDAAIATGHFSLVDFYGRRARRLLPAASITIVLVCVMAWILLPNTQWRALGEEVIASATYWQNILLYYRETDYLQADLAEGPLRHFWSLSVEEQFYIFWPVLLLLLLWAPGVKRNVRPALVILISAIFALSLGYSIYFSSYDPAGAYFHPLTRMWELALGGILVLVVDSISLRSGTRALLGWVGLACVLWSGFVYSDATIFPGYAALLPTLGTALLIINGVNPQTVSWDVRTLLERRAMVFVGDISYSLYLWHWPVLIFIPYIYSGIGSVWVVFVVSIVAAYFSKVWIEDPFRRHPQIKHSDRNTFLFSILLIGVCIGAGWYFIRSADAMLESSNLQILDDNIYVGAGTKLGIKVESAEAFQPNLQAVRGDIPKMYEAGCHASRTDDQPKPCRYGQLENPTLSIALVGDSHAAHWAPALREVVESRNWKLSTFTKSSCPFASVPVIVAQQQYPSCSIWNQNVRQQLLQERPDVVITSQITNHFAAGATSAEDNLQRLQAGLVEHWRHLTKIGVRVIPIRGTPRFSELVPDCIAKNTNWEACNLPRGTALDFLDPMIGAAATAQLELLDTTDWLCEVAECPVVVGNVLVYRDQHHITRTYARTLAPLIETAVLQRLYR